MNGNKFDIDNIEGTGERIKKCRAQRETYCIDIQNETKRKSWTGPKKWG